LSGEYRVIDCVEQIKTTRLLTVQANQPDDWTSTVVGQDVFCRRQPTAAELAASRKIKRVSFSG
jgi:hypothetical protein